ncbi:MAG TPA: SDR family NAD(P)-dependent oxidoreductase, partial [Marmoricola sp.]
MTDLSGKVALITGAGRGQGEAEARLFAELGARVVVADVLDDEVAAVASELGSDRALAVHLDVREPGQWLAALSMAQETFGFVDVLVNNAGIYFQASVADTPLERYRRLIDVNQIGVFL